MNRDLVFMDTETVGLHLGPDVIWEFFATRVSPGGATRDLHLLIEHDQDAAGSLPNPFCEDHKARWDWRAAYTRLAAAQTIHSFTFGRPHIVGAVPNFDTERVALLMRDFGLVPDWHYHLIDIENLAVGYLAARGEKVELPWDSDELSARLGVTPPGTGVRHTAQGDVAWAMEMYSRIVS